MKQFKILFTLCFSILFLLILFSIKVTAETKDKMAKAQARMVKYQIKLRGVTDSGILQAMQTVPRHEFVPKIKTAAYEDRPQPIGYGQTISQPYIVALMTELLQPDKNDKVLEVGTGSGYQAAILAQLVSRVYSVEIVKPLHERSKQVLKQLGYNNIFTYHGDGYYGWSENGPYDAIVVTCASEFVPPPLIEQLKPGGRMCIPVGPPFKVQHLVLIEKEPDSSLRTTIIASVRFVPLVRSGN